MRRGAAVLLCGVLMAAGPLRVWSDAAGEALFRPPEASHALVGPDGEFVAVQRLRGGTSEVVVYQVRGRASAVPVRYARSDVVGMAWADVDSLVVTVKPRRFDDLHTLVLDLEVSGGVLRATRRRILTPGTVVHALPHLEDRILYAPWKTPPSVYELRLSELAGSGARDGAEPDGGQFVDERRVASLEGRVFSWIADRHGAVRAALAVEVEPRPTAQLWYRDDGEGEWRVAHEAPLEDFDLVPLGFARDDRTLLVASDSGRDTYALFEFDPERGERGRLLYETPTTQITGIVFDFSGTEVLGVSHYEEGATAYHHFDTSNRRFQHAFERRFPGEHVVITSMSRDRRVLTVLVRSARNPGVFYLFEAESRTAAVVGRVAPWIEPSELSPVERLTVAGADGTPIEAFLTRARGGGGKPPLVVMPHGGPIGVRDDRGFDPVAQYLAQGGFAVLKVNYRGSSGYGRRFQEAGRGEWGRAIEDDIEAAVAGVIERGFVDPERSCIVGGSYGGYSALMSLVRFPGRYRCAATIAGVTDIPLMFQTSDFSASEWGREQFAKRVGDPVADYERLKRTSPVYRVAELQAPVHVAHGTADRRVDVEHAHRLVAMLELHGKAYEWLPLEGTSHSFGSPEEALGYYRKLRAFLVQQLAAAGGG